MKTIKLLYITNSIIGSGGLERVLSVKATYLTEQMDYEVHIVSLNQNKRKPFYNFSEKIVFHDITTNNKYLYFFQYIFGLKKIIKQIKPDVISVCDDGVKGLFAPLFLFKPCPMIYERHAAVEINFNNELKLTKIEKRLKHLLMRWAGSFYDKLVVLTYGNTKDWELKNMEVIPNPLPFNHKGVSNLNQRKILAVGSHSYIKGTDLLLDLWGEIFEKYPDWSLDIYGKSTENKKFEKLAIDKKLKNVYFYPPTNDIQDKYLNTSIFVLPSRSEGFGMVLIEAMSIGVPVVSFNCPHGPGDIITDNFDGFLIKTENIVQFAQQLDLLINDHVMRKKMGENALETSQKYSVEAIMQKWNYIFNSLIKV